MQLANNWKIKLDNQFWLTIRNNVQEIEITFYKEKPYYRIEYLGDLEVIDEMTYVIGFDKDEHQMICEIYKELYDVD